MSEQIKNNLWSLVENSNVYSFEKNPLPVFAILSLRTYSALSDTDKSLIMNNEDWKDFISMGIRNCGLMNENASEEETSFYETFLNIIISEVNSDIELLSEIIDFFAEKYFSIISKCKNIPMMSEELSNLMYWFALGEECLTNDTAIYNPYAGYAQFGKEHNKGLKLQLGYSLDDEKDPEKREETKDWYKEGAWYHGIESDAILRFIANLRLLVNSPMNLDQMYIREGDPLTDSMEGYKGGWTFIATPPFESFTKATKADVELVSKLVDKFNQTEAMECCYLLLPKCFCYDNLHREIRRYWVCRGLLRKVVELPNKLFKNDLDAVIIYLSKSSYECGIRVIDANQFMKDGKLQDWDLLRFNVSDENNKCGTFIGDYTISQCDYCVLPSMYLEPYVVQKGNDFLLKCYDKYYSFLESQRNSEERRIAHRDISGQLSHMLGATYHKISDAISELKYTEGMENTYCILRDCFDYMKRLINTIDEDFSTADMSVEEISVNDFFKSYTKGWSVYGKKNFNVFYETNVDNDTTFQVNEVFLKVLLDALLENANRHGFGNEEIQNPQIKISTSYTTVNNVECIQISVANNGVPFPEDFSLEQYISEGEFGGESGHTGRGGFHVYQITKRHKGYLSLNSDSEWNVNFDIMIPVEYYQKCETEKFKVYGKEYM